MMWLSDWVAGGNYLHSKEQCKASRKAGAPRNCVIHRPSLHRLTGSPQLVRETSLIEDICKHGVGHPNPDSVAFLNWRDDGDYWGIHGCDGCCGAVPERKSRIDWMDEAPES